MQVETDDMILFWQDDSIYSNWYHSPFTMGGHKFYHSEGGFIALKALTFGATIKGLVWQIRSNPR